MAADSLAQDFYVYCYLRPDGSPCYIGIGRGHRWKQHLRNSHNPRLRGIIAKAGGEVPHAKLHVGLTRTQAIAYEIALIKALGRAPNGPLVNMTDGGEGGPHTAETLAKMRAWHRGKKLSEEHRAKMRARMASPEARAKMRAARLGKPMSAETRAKISAAKRGSRKNAEHLAKLAAANRGSTLSPEARAKIAAANSRRKQTHETRAKLRAANLGKKRSPSAARRGWRLSPETRAKMRAAKRNTMSAETRAKIGEANRARRGMPRKPLAPEHRAKIAATLRRRSTLIVESQRDGVMQSEMFEI